MQKTGAHPAIHFAIDLDGDGIETVSQNAGIVFDTDADGPKTGTSWLKGDDGWLVLDKNNNGKMIMDQNFWRCVCKTRPELKTPTMHWAILIVITMA